MLPTTTMRLSRPGQSRSSCFAWSTYWRRFRKPKQMDFEYAFWVMLQLCISPKTVYLHTSYHKEMKNQWSRDDPAFLVVCCFFVIISGITYCVTFGKDLSSSLKIIVFFLFVEFLLTNIILSTICWIISNKLLRRKNMPSHTVEQTVEWMYAFDVQCNSYFPLFLMLHVLQFILCPLLLRNSFLASVCSCAMYVIALSQYCYLTFLGYNALPFLDKTVVFLYPVAFIFLCLPFLIFAKFNPTKLMLRLYFG